MASRRLLALAREDDAAMRTAFWEAASARSPALRFTLASRVEEVLPLLERDGEVAVLLLDMPTPILEELLAAASARGCRVHWVQTTSAGLDRFLTPAVRESGIPLCRVPEVFSQSLAEYVMMGFLYFAKRLPVLLEAQGAARWQSVQVRDLRGARLGIVGYGDIGQRIAHVAHGGFGMRVTGLRRHPGRSDLVRDVAEDVVGPDGLAQLLHESDYVALAAPATEHSRHLIGAEQLAAMPRHAVLANVGRGSLIDEVALERALAAKELAGAVLDVFAVEPLPESSPLWHRDDVLISAHTADNSEAWQARAIERAFENVDRWMQGLPPKYTIDTQEGY